MSSRKFLNFSNNKKSPVMLLTIAVMWILMNLMFLDNYYVFVTSQHTWLAKVFSLIDVGWILLTSFYACFHITTFLFSIIVKKIYIDMPRVYTETPRVAILYTCMNDAKEKAVAACLDQSYPNFAVYVLDDSTASEEQQFVDNLLRKYENRFSIIRRGDRSGYKAGNLNNALGLIGNLYTYVCVVDSDEIIPTTFIRELVSILEGNENLGFVQASHRQYSVTDYSKLISDNIDLHWKYFFPARNMFGFVYSYGHGVLLRTAALLKIGCFPEIASEDIAVSTKLREAGYKGCYAYDVEALEETPPSYQAFRRKNKKIVAGTLEFFTKFYWQFFRSKNVTFTEKLDLFFSLMVIYLPILFLFYVFSSFSLIPNRNELINMTAVFNDGYFIWFLFISVFAPLIYLLPSLIKSPGKVIIHILRMGTIHLSTCAQTTAIAMKWLVDKKTGFIPTGDRVHIYSNKSAIIEFLIGIGFIAAGIFTKSLYLIAIGLSLTFVLFMVKRNHQRKFALYLLPLPILITLIALFSAPISLVFATSAIFTGVVWAFY
jgi:cellulose synthase/poly-beta-1,6-N-acetylglucosamine synthase-like glycosyltransferase